MSAETPAGGPVAGDRPRRGTARARLIDAVTHIATHDGFDRLTVEGVLAASGASRATFYQYFTDVEDCFQSAYRAQAELLLADVRALKPTRDPELATLTLLIDTALHRPDTARLLITQGLAAGQLGLHERDALIAGIEQTVLAARRHGSSIDLPVGLVLGAAFRFISMRLAEDEVSEDLRDHLFEWLRAFPRYSSRARGWAELLAPAFPNQSRARSRSPRSPRLPPGPPRERIVRAAAAALAEKGYRATTVADIVAKSDVSRRLFYYNFQGKREAVLGAFEYCLEHLLGACTPAFFEAGTWPDRVWGSSLAFTTYLAGEPAFAHLGFIEALGVGADFAARVHQTQLAFTLFLQEGYRQGGAERPPSQAGAALTATAIMELCYQAARRGANPYLRRAQPLAVHLALTPFIGSEASGRFVSAKLSPSQ